MCALFSNDRPFSDPVFMSSSPQLWPGPTMTSCCVRSTPRFPPPCPSSRSSCWPNPNARPPISGTTSDAWHRSKNEGLGTFAVVPELVFLSQCHMFIFIVQLRKHFMGLLQSQHHSRTLSDIMGGHSCYVINVEKRRLLLLNRSTSRLIRLLLQAIVRTRFINRAPLEERTSLYVG